MTDPIAIVAPKGRKLTREGKLRQLLLTQHLRGDELAPLLAQVEELERLQKRPLAATLLADFAGRLLIQKAGLLVRLQMSSSEVQENVLAGLSQSQATARMNRTKTVPDHVKAWAVARQKRYHAEGATFEGTAARVAGELRDTHGFIVAPKTIDNWRKAVDRP